MTATLARCSRLAAAGLAACLAACDGRGASGDGAASLRERPSHRETATASAPAAVNPPEPPAKESPPQVEAGNPAAFGLPGLVDPRRLKAFLPESLDGLRRTNTKTEQHGAGASSVSLAEADYESEPDSTGASRAVTIRISDFGTAQELPEAEAGSSAIRVRASNRFLVEVEGRNAPRDALAAALGKVDLARLGSMKAIEAPK
jgi:hypothetical protein